MKNKSDEERSLIPVFFLIGIVLGPLIFIAGLVFGVQFNSSTKLSTDSMSSWVAALATVSIAVLTFVLAKETWYLRRAQAAQLDQIRREAIRPNIVVNIQPTMVSMNFWDVVIQNLGKGIAYNVIFSFQNMDGTNATVDNNHLIKIFNKLSIFQTGCSSLGLGQLIKSYLFGFSDLERDLGKDNIFQQKICIFISYEDAEGYPYTNKININFSDIKGISTLGGSNNPLYSIFKELETIRKIFEPVFKNRTKSIKVETYNSSDREQERENLKKYFEDQE